MIQDDNRRPKMTRRQKNPFQKIALSLSTASLLYLSGYLPAAGGAVPPVSKYIGSLAYAKQISSSDLQKRLEDYIASHQEQWLREDFEPFLRMECTSAKEDEDLAKKTECAAYLERLLRGKGYPVRVYVGKNTPKKELLKNPIETELDRIRPVIYFEIILDPSLPTILFGTHYDRRPENNNPNDTWKTHWLEAVRKKVTETFGNKTIHDTRIYARGSDDSIGHIMSIVWSLDAYKALYGKLPVNVKVMFEGAEEIGSPGMDKFVEKYRDLLKADIVLIEDSPTNKAGIPLICQRLRGTLDGKLCVQTAVKESHSGGGSYIPNAEGVLAAVMTQIENPLTKEVALDAWNNYQKPTPEEIGYVSKLRPDLTEKKVKEKYGVLATVGQGELAELTILKPSWDWQPVTQQGKEGVIPSQVCKVFMARLVPGQEPKEIFSELEEKVKHLPEAEYAKITVAYISDSPAFVMSKESRYYPTVREAVKRAFGATELEYVWDGAGEPIASYFQAQGFPVILTGWGSPDDNPHATNESMLVEHGLMLGVRGNVDIMESVGREYTAKK